jgi:hypothetical protein
MPKSKGKRQPVKKGYTPVTPAILKPKKRKESPKWFTVLILGLMLAGVLLIVLNYMNALPWTHGQADPRWLWGGLGLIGAGFIASTQLK